MTHRCGFIAVLGAANAGKSTFINTAVKEKVSIVTAKAHTTRNRIYGILCHDDTQMIFVDTPGLIEKPKGPLQNAMRKSFWKTAREADIILLMVDASKKSMHSTVRLLEKLRQREAPIFLVLNKVDAIKKAELLLQAEIYAKEAPFLEKIFMTSGKYNRGVDDVIEALTLYCPENPWVFSPDDITQVSKNFMAAEITREKLFQNIHEEVPYSIHVETETWHIPGMNQTAIQAPASGISIFQTIFVEKESQKKMVIGHGGQRLQKIGTDARKAMMEWLQEKVHLFLHVKVAPEWSSKPALYKESEKHL